MTDRNQLGLFNSQAKRQIEALKQEMETLERDIRPKVRIINENKSKIEVLEKYLAISDNQHLSKDIRYLRPSRRLGSTSSDRTVGNVAVEVLGRHGEPMHYTDVMHKMKHDEDFIVGGQDPKGNMLAHLANDARIIRVGKGIYALEKWSENK